jgi:anaerobic selenocysteine-containing dehydrogenase
MIRKSFCRICTGLCGILVDVEGDQVKSVRADVEHPLTEGYSCIKGRMAGELHHRHDRILHPMMRKDGVLTRVSWDELLDDLAAKLLKIRAESGPDAFGTFTGGGFYMDAGAFALRRPLASALGTRSTYSDSTIDGVVKVVVPELIAGFPGNPRPDHGRCKMIILLGTNPMVSHGHSTMLNNAAARLREFTATGEVWVIDPRRTETASKATRHLAPHPGTDYALLAYVIRELLRDGADWEYLNAHAQQVDELAAAVEPFTLQHAASVTRMPEADLADFLAAIRRNGRLSVETGTGPAMAPTANLITWLNWALMIVTGSLDRERGAWCNPGFFGSLDRLQLPPAPPEGRRGPGPRSRPEFDSVAGGEFACAAMADEIDAGHLRGLVNLSGELLACMPDAEGIARALAKLEVLATINIVETPTTRMSTHVLPAKDQLERADLSLGIDSCLPVIAGMYTPAMVAPQGEVRSYWWILTQLARRLGGGDLLPGVDPDTATEEEVITHIARSGRAPVDTSGEMSYTHAEDRSFGWLLKIADAMGGFRLAPAPLVRQLAQTRPPPDGLMLVSRRQLAQHNSRKIPSDRDIAAIFVNPDDARERGLGDGDLAELASANGRIQGQVKLDSTLRRGALNLPHGWMGDYNVNKLTGTRDADLLTGMALMSSFPVELTKARRPWPANG